MLRLRRPISFRNPRKKCLNFAPFFHNLRKEALSRYGYFAGALGNSPVIRKVTFAIRLTSFKLLGKEASRRLSESPES